MKPIHENQTGHEEFISCLCRLVGAMSYLELGVYKGDTLKRVAFDNPETSCVGVDRDFGTMSVPLNVNLHRCTTDVFFADIIGKRTVQTQFDVIFIDADHSAESVWKDLKNALRHVRDHGLILLHDTYPKDRAATEPGYCGTAWKVADDLTDVDPQMWDENQLYQLGIEAVTMPYHPGLTIIRKRSKHLAW